MFFPELGEGFPSLRCCPTDTVDGFTGAGWQGFLVLEKTTCLLRLLKAFLADALCAGITGREGVSPLVVVSKPDPGQLGFVLSQKAGAGAGA